MRVTGSVVVGVDGLGETEVQWERTAIVLVWVDSESAVARVAVAESRLEDARCAAVHINRQP